METYEFLYHNESTLKKFLAFLVHDNSNARTEIRTLVSISLTYVEDLDGDFEKKNSN